MQHSPRRWTHYVFGSRSFYGVVLALALPMVIQNLVTASLGLLNNIMVGTLGDELMSSVSIANNPLFIYNITIFGAVSAASIFGAQFFGAKDYEGMRAATRFKFYVCAGTFVLTALILLFFDKPIISLYLKGETDPEKIAMTLAASRGYLRIMLAGLLPFAISQAYTSTLREAGETILPMYSAVAAILTNLLLNYLLIFGNLGAPKMGVNGAAVATVIARFVEMAVVMIGAHADRARHFFLVGLFKTLRVPASLVRHIAWRGLPLMVNETLWAFGTTTLSQLYSTGGLNVVAGLSISDTVTQIVNGIVFSVGNVIATMVGQSLGAGEREEASETAWRLISLSVMCSFVLAAVLAIAAPFAPLAYDVSAEARAYATRFLWILAAAMPLMAFAHCTYFTLRSGGKTMLTFVFDSVAIWVVSVPAVYLAVHVLNLPMTWVYFISQMTTFAKCVLGFVLIKRGGWIHTMTVPRVDAA